MARILHAIWKVGFNTHPNSTVEDYLPKFTNRSNDQVMTHADQKQMLIAWAESL